MAKYSKRNYRKALHVVRAIVEETDKTIGRGDSQGQEYSFLDQVTIYETALEAITVAVGFGLKPVEKDEPGSTGASHDEESGDFSTICPYCKHNGITVIEVTLVSDGFVLNPMVPLEQDGFAFETPDDRKDTSTQDEVVRCNNCGCEFGLDELM